MNNTDALDTLIASFKNIERMLADLIQPQNLDRLTPENQKKLHEQILISIENIQQLESILTKKSATTKEIKSSFEAALAQILKSKTPTLSDKS